MKIHSYEMIDDEKFSFSQLTCERGLIIVNLICQNASGMLN